jgi:hypothetical protein
VAVDSEHKTALTPARSVSAFAGEIIRGDAMDTKKPQQIPTQPTIDMLLEFALSQGTAPGGQQSGMPCAVDVSAETDMSTVSDGCEEWPAMLAIGSIATETATIRVRMV